MKVALLTICSPDTVNQNLEEIGMCSIAAYLRAHGHTVMIAQKNAADIDYRAVGDFDPDLIGYTIYETAKQLAFDSAEIVRNMLPRACLFAGGYYPSTNYKELFDETNLFDYVVRGEGEQTVLELCECMMGLRAAEEICGLIFRAGGELILNEPRSILQDLDTLPWIARDVLQDNQLKVAMISTSRGCYGNCSFCSNQIMWKNWRGRRVGDIADEIEYLFRAHHIVFFNFTDASFEDPDGCCTRMKELMNALAERELPIGYIADFRAEISRKIDAGILPLMECSGLIGACIGVESGNEPDMQLYKKLATVEDSVKTLKLFQEKFVTICEFININPYSTFEGLKENAMFLRKTGIASILEKIATQYGMYKNSALYQKIKDDGLLRDGDFSKYGYRFINPSIETFQTFLSGYLGRLHARYREGYKFMTSYLTRLECFLSFIQRMNPQDEYYMTALSRMREWKSRMNTVHMDCYDRLLDLAESGWDVDAAEQIAQQFLSDVYIQSCISFVNILTRTVKKHLIRTKNPYIQLIKSI